MGVGVGGCLLRCVHFAWLACLYAVPDEAHRKGWLVLSLLPKGFLSCRLHCTSFLGAFVYRLPSALLETSQRQPLLSLFDPCHALEQSHESEAPSELLKSQEGEVLGPLWLWCLTWHMMTLD